MVTTALAASRAGEMDRSFGGDGVIRTSWAPRWASPTGVAVTPSGKTVVAGLIGGFTQTGLVRYMPGGALDRSFAGDGTLKTHFAGGNLTASDVLVGKRHRILIGGSGRTSGEDRYGVALGRLKPGGGIDSSFSGDGFVFHSLGRHSQIFEMTFDDVGRIVVVGSATVGERKPTFLVARFHKNGSLDGSFSGNGWRHVFFGKAASSGYSVTLDGRGRIVVGGQVGGQGGSNGLMGVARLHPDGTLDQSFSRNGKTLTRLYEGGYLRDIAVDSRSRIVAFGYADGGGVARYLPNGRLDPSFSGDGMVRALQRWMVPGSVVVDARDRIILAGAWNTDFGSDAIVMRVTERGRVDQRFGTGVAWARGIYDLNDATMDAQGRIVVTGRAIPGRSDSLFGTARLINR